MAKQHFYARVPAKLSLFNRMDGYDTFAYSDGLSREWIEREIAPAYSVPPAKDDLPLIQNGKLPPAFCHTVTADGTVLQSAVSFLSSDYTGERTAYMVHSLALSEEESDALLGNDSTATLDASVFMTDLSAFHLTDADAKPQTDYPELALKPVAVEDPKLLTEQYDTGMLKRLIYALIGISCKKTKALFLSLPESPATFSTACLSFLNRALSVFPRHMRKSLSFITYTGDFTKYSAYKIRCVPEKVKVPTAKGVSLKFGALEADGISDQNVAAYGVLVDFFYRLLTAEDLRKAFLSFCDYAVTAVPALASPSFKNLNDLVLLFRVQSGFFSEKQVLPDDNTLFDYLTVYAKNRTAVPENFRKTSMQCLMRYPQNRVEMPKNIFTKVSALYPEEPAVSKKTVMEIVLHLIHTDAMREKLFSFIKANYDGESPETKRVILENLCRVYYGGFLQSQSLEFFAEHFETEPAESRKEILEKLLLTVRTPQVQESVLAFADRFFPIFTEAEKDLYYNTFYEMLPDGDALTRAMADLVDRYIDEDRKPAVAKQVLAAVSADQRKKEPTVCAALATKCGFIQSLLIEKIFTEWTDRKVFETFCSNICNNPLPVRMEILRDIRTAVPDLSPEAEDRLMTALKENFQNGPRAGLFEVIDAVDAATALAKEVPAAADFCDTLKGELLYPEARMLLPMAFDRKRFPNGLEKLCALLENHTYLTASEYYPQITAYRSLIDALSGNNGAGAFESACRLSGKTVKSCVAEQVKKTFATADLPNESRLCVTMVVEYLQKGDYGFAAAANDLKARISAENADETVLTVVLTVAGKLFGANLPEDLHTALPADGGELQRYLSAYVLSHEKKGKKFLNETAQSLALPPELLATVQKSAAAKPVSSGGFLKKLFHK